MRSLFKPLGGDEMLDDSTLHYQLQQLNAQLQQARTEETPAQKPIAYMNTGSDPATGGAAPVYDRFDLALLSVLRDDRAKHEFY